MIIYVYMNQKFIAASCLSPEALLELVELVEICMGYA